MKITAEPRSDQWNADDFVGGPKTFTISGVKVGVAEQKYDIELAEGEGRAWRPPLTVLRILKAAWGDESDDWIGHRVTLYRDPEIRFGKDATGGIRVSHMSHLPGNKTLSIALQESRGKRKPHRIDPLPDEPTPAQPKAPTATGIIAAFDSLGVTVEQLEARIGSAHDQWAAEDIASLAALGKAIKAGESTVYEEFETAETTDAVGTQGELK